MLLGVVVAAEWRGQIAERLRDGSSLEASCSRFTRDRLTKSADPAVPNIRARVAARARPRIRGKHYDRRKAVRDAKLHPTLLTLPGRQGWWSAEPDYQVLWGRQGFRFDDV